MLKWPKTVGGAADLLYTLQQQRLEKSKEIKELKEQEDALEDHILKNMLPAAGLQGAKGSVGQVSMEPYDWADVSDWDKFFAYLGKTKNWELVQKRPSITALRELWEGGEVVPGAERKSGYKLHVSKIGGKK